MNIEDFCQASDPEDLQDPLVGADHRQIPLMSPDSLEPTDQHPQAGGVQKLNRLHIDDQLVAPLGHEVDYLFPHPRRCIYVNLTGYLQDSCRTCITSRQRQIHRVPPFDGSSVPLPYRVAGRFKEIQKVTGSARPVPEHERTM